MSDTYRGGRPFGAEALSAMLDSNAALVLERLMPMGELQGNELVDINPNREDSKPGSFRINVETLLWADFAMENVGGKGLLSLAEYLGYDLPQLSRMVRDLEIVPDKPTRSRKKANGAAGAPGVTRPAPKSRPPAEPILPEDLKVLPPDSHPDHGPVSTAYEYRDGEGRVAFFVLRFDTPDGKRLSTCRWLESEGRWDWSNPPGERPLYRADLVTPGCDVVFSEGEKTADHLQALYRDCVSMTSSGGSSRLWESDLSPLREVASVRLFPDADEPGVKFAAQVGAYCRLFDVQVSVLNTVGLGWKGGEDAADYPELDDEDYQLEVFEEWLARQDEVGLRAVATVGARLDPLLYSRFQKTLAAMAGVGVRALDKAVKEVPPRTMDTLLSLEPPPPPDPLAEYSEEELEEAVDLLREPNLLARVVRFCHESMGLVGEDRLIQAIQLAMVSRLLENGRPVSVVVKGPSGSGKSYSVQQVTCLHPSKALYSFTAASQRALVFTPEEFSHRVIWVAEANQLNSGADENNILAQMLRSLLSEGRIIYEISEKDVEGNMTTRRIVKEGPTGLILGTTADKIHAENETRMLSLYTDDSEAQTARIVTAAAAAQASETDQSVELRDAQLRVWQAAHLLLEVQGVRKVSIPFLPDVVAAVRRMPTRFRRDLTSTVPGLIRASALLHQHTREIVDGRVVATLEDYELVRLIVDDTLSRELDGALSDRERKVLGAIVGSEADPAGWHKVSQRSIGSATGIPQRTVGRIIERLVEAELLAVPLGVQGQVAKLKPGASYSTEILEGGSGVLPSRDTLENTSV